MPITDNVLIRDCLAEYGLQSMCGTYAGISYRSYRKSGPTVYMRNRVHKIHGAGLRGIFRSY